MSLLLFFFLFLWSVSLCELPAARVLLEQTTGSFNSLNLLDGGGFRQSDPKIALLEVETTSSQEFVAFVKASSWDLFS